MKTILVPTDGSEAAVKALDVALDLAEKHDAMQEARRLAGLFQQYAGGKSR